MKLKMAVAALLAAFASRALALHAEFGAQDTYPAFLAGTDLTNFKYRVMRPTTTLGVCSIASNAVSADAAEMPLGVLQNNPSSGNEATIAFMGLSKVKAGAAITVHELITTDGSGYAIVATSGNIVIGRALEAAGAAGDIVTAMLFPPVRGGSDA